ncbi:MAG: hypothetical protein EXS48_02645 [Candidatus Staskawiczbacteria bacterium]|nr:hypothetical protein [Candidatus Staskawiczbacteria bacterium]
MITIFSNPRGFLGHFNIIQRNAIKSWIKSCPRCEIILLGQEEGIKEVADEFNIRYIPEVKKNEYGTPLLGSVFEIAQREAKNPLMVYISADIILTSDFIEAVKSIKQQNFLAIGQRIDLDVTEELQFDSPEWEKKLLYRLGQGGQKHGLGGSDYFIFPRGLYKDVPLFAIGRTIHDNWLIYKVRALGFPVIDATEAIIAIHQEHEHFRNSGGLAASIKAQEAKINLELAGGYSHVFTLQDANLRLTKQGIKKPKITIQYLQQYFWTLPVLYPGIGAWPKIVSLMLSPRRLAGKILRILRIR